MWVLPALSTYDTRRYHYARRAKEQRLTLLKLLYKPIFIHIHTQSCPIALDLHPVHHTSTPASIRTRPAPSLP